MTDDDVALPDEDAAPPADAASPVDSAPASDAVAWSAPVVKSDAVVIHAKGLTKRYGSRTAVDHLTLDVRRGEIFGLLGPNGAGKTTTVLMLLGLTEPTSGEALVLGLNPTRNPLHVKRRVGYLPDSVGFYGNLTGRENLRYTARLNGIPRRDADLRIGDVLGQVGLASRADDRTDGYSRGMRQRLGIADALVKDPEILILDEPTTAIDPIGVVEILDLIRGLARDRGLAILLASHLLDQVQSVCNRVGIFHEGKVIGQGTVEALAVEFGEDMQWLEVGVERDGAGAADPRALLEAVPGRRIRRIGRLGGGRPPRRVPCRRRARSRRAGGGSRCRRRRAEQRSPAGALRPVAAVARADLPACRAAPVRGRGMSPVKAKTVRPRRPASLVVATAGSGGTAALAPAPVLQDTHPFTNPPRAGWTVVAGKEFGDHLRSARFYVLLALLGLVAIGTTYVAADTIRSVGEAATGVPSIFLKPFLLGQDPIPSFVALIGFIVPVLGIAFGFDAVSGERAEGTLPRLVSQPIYRDDVINGKFAAGLAVIGLILIVITCFVAGVTIIRLGITPSAEDVVRLAVWLVISVIYVGFWLAFATLCSVAFRRAATALLVAIGAWIVATLFASLLASIAAGILAPAGTDAAPDKVIANATLSDTLSRLAPPTLYNEATSIILDPSARTTSSLLLAQQVDRAVASTLPLTQSLLLVWIQVVAIVGLTVVSFAVAYVLFMRQEVRA